MMNMYLLLDTSTFQLQDNFKQYLALVQPLANILKMPLEKPNNSDFEEEMNLDPHWLRCEFETFVAHFLSKELSILSTHKVTTFEH